MKTVGRVKWLPDGVEQEAKEELSLLAHAMIEDRDHPQACGGQADCGTCRVRVVEGMDNLTPYTVDERELREDFPEHFAVDERLACQCRPTGDVTIALPDPPPPDLRYI